MVVIFRTKEMQEKWGRELQEVRGVVKMNARVP